MLVKTLSKQLDQVKNIRTAEGAQERTKKFS
jgi:hypothetical protein